MLTRLLLLGFLLAGCGLSDPDRGLVVTEGVARAVFEQRVRHGDVRQTVVLYPADAEGRRVGSAHPALVFVHGGSVPPGRYEWLAQLLARDGFVVALPSHPLDLAFFEIDNGAFSRELLTSSSSELLDGAVDPSRIAVAGHSLGGVVAVKLALAGGFCALVLEGSFPDAADEPATRASTLPSLSLAGRADCKARLDSVRAGAEALGSPTALVVLDGVTHYQFTDSDQEDQDARCEAGVGLEVAHQRIAEAVRVFLQAAHRGQGVGVASLRAMVGAEVTVR